MGRRLAYVAVGCLVVSTASLRLGPQEGPREGPSSCDQIPFRRADLDPEAGGLVGMLARHLRRLNDTVADKFLHLARVFCNVVQASKANPQGFQCTLGPNAPANDNASIYASLVLCEQGTSYAGAGAPGAQFMTQLSGETVYSGGRQWPLHQYGTTMGTEEADADFVLWGAFLGLMNDVYIPPAFRTERFQQLSEDINLDEDWRHDAEGRFCHDLLAYMWGHPHQSSNCYPAVYAGHDHVDSYVRACRREFELLPQEERAILEPFHAAGGIPESVLMPVDHHAKVKDATRRQGRARGVAPSETEQMTAEELREVIREGATVAGRCPGTDCDVALNESLKYWGSVDVRKPKRIPAEWAEVRKAIVNDEVAVFDARPLFPADIWGTSVQQMAAAEDGGGDRIPIWSDMMKASSLAAYSEHMTQIEGNPNHFDPQHPTASAKGYANTKRFPKFFERLPDVTKELGLEENVTRMESFLWMGKVFPGIHEFSTQQTPGGLHFDEESNFYVQVRGETQYVILPLNFTDAAFGAERTPPYPSFKELQEDPYFKNVTFHTVRMRPGDGVTFPGRAYHAVHALTDDRIALNFFFIPKWRKMEHTPENWYSREASHSLERLAVRQLWARSFARVWDTEKKGMMFMGRKLEYL